MGKEVGYLVAWEDELKYQHWEYIDLQDTEGLVARYDSLVGEYGEPYVYVFPVENILSLIDTRRIIAAKREEVQEYEGIQYFQG